MLAQKKLTGITIEIDPDRKSSLIGANPSHLQGEPIINYSSRNGIVYFVNHLYPNDDIRFDLKFNKSLEKIPDKIDVKTRSNEVEGVELGTYLVNYMRFSAIIELGALIVTAGIVLRVMIIYYKNTNKMIAELEKRVKLKSPQALKKIRKQ